MALEVQYGILPTEIGFFIKPTGRESISYGINKPVLYYKMCVVETGAGPDLINAAHLRPHGKYCIMRLDVPNPQSATKNSIKVQGIDLMIMKMVTISVRRTFAVGEGMAL